MTIMEKVIVTGSDGFIGRVLAERLRRIGYEVFGIDRKSGHDIREVSGLLRAGGVRYVFHLAAQTSVFNTDHQKIFDDNLEAFYYVCDHCKMNGVKLVYASSSTAEPCNTTSMYGLSKNFAERYAFIYNREATGVRLHNVYGANPRQGTLLHTLLNNECVTLYNNGANVRCFTFIDDIVEGLIHAASIVVPLLNCVNNEPMTILKFARMVQELQIEHAMEPVKLNVVPQVREHDNPEQSVNNSIPAIRLRYRSVSEGLKLCFDEKEE